MIIVLSVVFGICHLLAIAWIAKNSSLTTVDGLFTTLILLALSGILFMNAFLSIRKRLHPKDKAPEAQKAC